MVWFRVSYSSWKLPQRQPAVVTEHTWCYLGPARCCMSHGCTENPTIFILLFALLSTYKPRAQVPPQEYRRQVSCDGSGLAPGTCLWAVCGSLPGHPGLLMGSSSAWCWSVWSCLEESGCAGTRVWGSVWERKTYWCVYAWGVFVCACTCMADLLQCSYMWVGREWEQGLCSV